MKKKILISGFEAFGGQKINPTALLIEALKNNEISTPAHFDIHPLLLPVTFGESFQKLQEKMQELKPEMIICLGQAGGRAHIELERVAINCLDADIPDNSGFQPRDEKITSHGESAYFSTLPLRKFEAALKHAQIPVKISNSAGTYVCNYLFYQLMQEVRGTQIEAGFIHVPYLPEQAKKGEPTMSIEELKRALEALLAVSG